MIHDNSTTVVHCVLDSYGSVPNIEEESYDTENSSASISLSSLHQHQRPPSRAEAVAGRPRLPQLPLLPQLPQLPPPAAPTFPAAVRPAGFKRPCWDWNQSKNNILPKNQTTVQTLDCARSDLSLCLSDIYSVTWANSLQIYTVKVQSSHCKLNFCWTC